MNETGKLTKFTNCCILRNHKIIDDDLWIRDGKIVDPQKLFFSEKKKADKVIDCKNALISPGFIDLQVNGGVGVDFSYNLEDIEEGLRKVAKFLLKTGVTAFCPTLVSSKADVYKKVLPKLKPQQGGTWGATVLGAHVEGPFINYAKHGAHENDNILQFYKGIKSVQDVYGYLESIKIVTLAPELEHALDVIHYLCDEGIVVSLGHSIADFTTGEKAVCAGATLITHLFNAMLPFHHRDPGLVGLLTAKSIRKTVFFGIISDGHHTHPAALRIAYRTYYPGLILVTDCNSSIGLENGIHHIGNKLLEVKNGAAYIANTDTLCGSITPLNKCVQIFIKATDCSIVEALEAATIHPAQVLGIEDNKGTLNYGADADFILLDKNFDVSSTWIAGNCVYSI